MAGIIEEVFTHNNLVHAISGAVGGTVSLSLFFPLNNIRLLLQVDESLKDGNVAAVGYRIVKRDGVGALYKGWCSNSVCVGTSAFIYFYTYNALKVLHRTRVSAVGELSAAANLAIATIAGVINVVATAPLWVAGTRLATQKSGDGGAATLLGLLRDIARKEGVGSFWKDLGPSLLLVSNPALQFLTYERLRMAMRRIAGRRGRSISPLEFFLMGALAKMNATLWTYPMQIVQSKLRAGKRNADGDNRPEYSGTLDCLRKILARDGLAGWYKGLEAKLWQTVLTSAFQFLAYEQLQGVIFALLAPKPAAMEGDLTACGASEDAPVGAAAATPRPLDCAAGAARSGLEAELAPRNFGADASALRPVAARSSEL